MSTFNRTTYNKVGEPYSAFNKEMENTDVVNDIVKTIGGALNRDSIRSVVVTCYDDSSWKWEKQEFTYEQKDAINALMRLNVSREQATKTVKELTQ